MLYKSLFFVTLVLPVGCAVEDTAPQVEDGAPSEESELVDEASSDLRAGGDSGTVMCYVFNDGYTAMAGPADAVYILGASQACIPDGTSSGTCRKWFGRCFKRTNGQSDVPIYFRVFEDGYANQSIEADAVYMNSPLQACIPDSTPRGACRKWFGRAFTRDGGSTQPVQFNIFGDGYIFQVGPSDAIFWNGSQLCVPDGTASGTCRKWFGRGIL